MIARRLESVPSNHHKARMSHEPDNLVLVYQRRLDEKLDRLIGIDRIEIHLDRIERRLDLVAPSPA
jgi:hypothetical protein